MSTDVRELLQRAVAEVPGPGRGTDEVFARAARVRARRRVVGVVVAAVVAGVVSVGVVGLPSRSGEQSTVTPSHSDSVPGIVKLLPEGIGEVSEAPYLRVPPTSDVWRTGPYVGDYAVERDGGTGYLMVGTSGGMRRGPDLCSGPLSGPGRETFGCTSERLPDGSRLWTWETTAGDGSAAGNWGAEINARLLREDGTLVTVRASTGTTDRRPLLDSYPLTRTQLRELVLRLDSAM